MSRIVYYLEPKTRDLNRYKYELAQIENAIDELGAKNRFDSADKAERFLSVLLQAGYVMNSQFQVGCSHY